MRNGLYGIVVLYALMTSGCSKDLEGDLYNLQNYGDIHPQKIQFDGVTWEILDKPTEVRMIVVSLGAWHGVTEALVEQTDGAARTYFRHANRHCSIDSRQLASGADGSIEYFYSCKNQGHFVVLRR